MDPAARVWGEISQADVITMYFVEAALEKIRPRLEEALDGQKCKVVTCGYPMPSWQPRWVETILGLPVCLYDIGGPAMEEPRELTGEELEKALQERPQIPPAEGVAFWNEPNEGGERIEVPLFDESEKIDYHWDDFDQEPPEDLDGNTAISQWRKPE